MRERKSESERERESVRYGEASRAIRSGAKIATANRTANKERERKEWKEVPPYVEVRRRIEKWRATGSPARLLKGIANGIRPEIQAPARPASVREYPLTEEDLRYWREIERGRLLRGGIIEHARSEQVELSHAGFFVPKADGSRRLVVDLTARGRGANRFHVPPDFSMEGLELVRASIEAGRQDIAMISFDVAEAFYILEVHEQARRYFGLRMDGETFRMRGMPMGFNGSSAWLALAMGHLMSHFRRNGLAGIQYADDFLIFVSGTRRGMGAQIAWLRRELRAFGLRTKDAKCTWTPTRRIQHLGVIVDLEQQRFEVPTGKAEDIRRRAHRLLSCGARAPARDLAVLAGKGQALRLALPRVGLRLRAIYDVIGSCTRGTRRLGRQARRDLYWWARVPIAWAPIWLPLATHALHTDASGLAGWGAVLDWHRRTEDTAQGLWDAGADREHIQVLEARAVRLALGHWEDRLRGQHVELFVDNVAVVYALNRWSSKSAGIMAELRLIEEWSARCGCTWRATYIRSSDNSLADELSRQDQDGWTLPRGTVRQLWARWWKPDVDRFATLQNRVCEAYFSLHPEREALGQDGLVGSWSGSRSWAFPPPHLVDDVLRKLELEPDAEAIVIVPRWSRAAWWPRLGRVLDDITEIAAPARSPSGRYYAMIAGIRRN